MSVFKEPSSSEEGVKKSLNVLPMPTITPSAASATQDTSSTMTTLNASLFRLPSLTVLLTHSSMVLVALAILVFSNNH